MKILGVILALFGAASTHADEILHCGRLYPEHVQVVQGIEYFNGTWIKAPALSVIYEYVYPFLLKTDGTIIQLSDETMQKAGPYYYNIPGYDDPRQAALWGEIQNAAIWPAVCLSISHYEVSYRIGETLIEAIQAAPVKP